MLNKKLLYLLVMGVCITMPKPALAAVPLSTVYAFGSIKSMGDLVSYIVPIALTIAGIMVSFYFLTACFNYINSHGDKNAVSAARQQIEHSIIGLIILLASFIVVRYMPTAMGLIGVPPIFGL